MADSSTFHAPELAENLHFCRKWECFYFVWSFLYSFLYLHTLDCLPPDLALLNTFVWQVQAVTVHATNNYFVTASLDSTWCFYELSSGLCLTQVQTLSLTLTHKGAKYVYFSAFLILYLFWLEFYFWLVLYRLCR